MSDINCPYCDHEIDVCNDDGHGMDENKAFHEECPNCEKTFVFTACFDIVYTAYEAKCLNGEGDHEWYCNRAYPIEFMKMRCKVCDEERAPSAEEMNAEIKRRENP